MVQTYSEISSLEKSIIALSEVVRKQADFIKATYNISSLEMDLIQHIVENGPQKMKVVSEHFRIKLSTFTSIVDKAEKNRILKRVNSKEDRRVVFLDVTKKGRDVFQKYTENLKNLLQELSQTLPPHEFEHFVKGLEAFSQVSMNPES